MSDLARREAALQAEFGLNPALADEEACLAQLSLRARLLNPAFQVRSQLVLHLQHCRRVFALICAVDSNFNLDSIL